MFHHIFSFFLSNKAYLPSRSCDYKQIMFKAESWFFSYLYYFKTIFLLSFFRKQNMILTRWASFCWNSEMVDSFWFYCFIEKLLFKVLRNDSSNINFRTTQQHTSECQHIYMTFEDSSFPKVNSVMWFAICMNITLVSYGVFIYILSGIAAWRKVDERIRMLVLCVCVFVLISLHFS